MNVNKLFIRVCRIASLYDIQTADKEDMVQDIIESLLVGGNKKNFCESYIRRLCDRWVKVHKDINVAYLEDEKAVDDTKLNSVLSSVYCDWVTSRILENENLTTEDKRFYMLRLDGMSVGEAIRASGITTKQNTLNRLRRELTKLGVGNENHLYGKRLIFRPSPINLSC